ncbi:MAG: hypothetical protein ACPGO5_03080 [Patescibacteria group bacterium]
MAKNIVIPLTPDMYKALFDNGKAEVISTKRQLIVDRTYIGSATISLSFRGKYPMDEVGNVRIRFRVTRTHGDGRATAVAFVYTISTSKMSCLLRGRSVVIKKKNGWKTRGMYMVRAQFTGQAARKRNQKYIDNRGFVRRRVKVLSRSGNMMTIKAI